MKAKHAKRLSAGYRAEKAELKRRIAAAKRNGGGK